MKKKGQITGTIFIPFIIVVIIIGIIFGFINAQRTTTPITDDQFTASNTSCVEVTEECISSIVSLENSTGSTIIGSANYTVCTATGTTNEYDGILLTGDTITNEDYNGKTLNATYVEISCSHISGLTGTLIDYIPVLLGVVVLVGVAVYVK